MEKIMKIQAYLETEEITKLSNDLDFSNVLKEAKDYFGKTNNERFLTILSEVQKENYLKLSDNIQDSFKSYVATKNNQYCLLINHYISDGYNLFFTEIKNFEQKFIEILTISNSNISKLDTDLQKTINKFNNAIANLENTKEHCRNTTNQVERLMIDARNRVNSFAETMNTENESRIEAKRKQIDNDLSIYRKGIEETFNSWVKKFENLEGSRKQFLEMYEIGIKYSKDARFDEYALKEKKIADMLRWLSLSLMTLVVIAIGYLTYKSIADNSAQTHPNIYISIFNIISRFLLVFSLMIPAVYASRESGRHRQNSDKYAQMANELKAFEIAIRTENMREKTRDRIKEKIFEKYFGNIFTNTVTERNISEDFIDFMKAMKSKK